MKKQVKLTRFISLVLFAAVLLPPASGWAMGRKPKTPDQELLGEESYRVEKQSEEEEAVREEEENLAVPVEDERYQQHYQEPVDSNRLL